MKNIGRSIAAIGLVLALLSVAPFLVTVALSQEPVSPAAEGALMQVGGACGMAVMALGIGLFSAGVLFRRSLRPVLLSGPEQAAERGSTADAFSWPVRG